MKDFDT